MIGSGSFFGCISRLLHYNDIKHVNADKMASEVHKNKQLKICRKCAYLCNFAMLTGYNETATL
jgi:hypothetical protein